MKNTLPILYSFRRCPYAMRARLALAKSGQGVELREVSLKDKPVSMLEFSPKGTVPVLVLPDRSVIDESLEIMKWALSHNDPDSWLDKTSMELIDENDSTFKMHLDKYKYFNRHPENDQKHYRQLGEIFIKKLDNLLSDRAFLSGDHMRFVDAAILPFVRQFASVEPEWLGSSPYTNVHRWLETFLDSDLFTQIMKKYVLWKPGNTPVFFPSD